MTKQRKKSPPPVGTHPGSPQPPHRSGHLLLIFMLLLISFGLRILPYYSLTFTDGNPVIKDPDACYHLRRAEMMIHSFPDIPVFDSYMNHPFGAYIIWPPLYDLIIAGAWGCVNLFSGGTTLPGTLTLLPVLLSALTVLVVYMTGLRLWSGKKWYAFAAAIAPAILPIMILYSYVGQLDHHAAEFLCVALFMYGLIRSVPELQKARTFALSWLLPGLFLGLGLLVQHGLLLLEIILILALLPFAVQRSRHHYWAFGAVVNGVALLVTLPFGLSGHLQGVPLSHTHFGLFQPLVLLDMALLFFTLWFATAPHSKILRTVKYPVCIITAGAAVVLSGFLLHHIVAGTTYLVRTWSGWQAQIAESHSLLRTSWDRALEELSGYMSWAVFLLPIVWVIMFHRWNRLSSQERILCLSTCAFTAFGLFQIRYLPYCAILFGLITVSLVDFIIKKWSRKKMVGLISIIVLLAGYYPCTRVIGGEDVTFGVYTEMEPILKILREKSPPDSLYIYPDTSPGTGVVADWNLGHYIQYYGHWPVLADNFGEHATDLSRLNRFFFGTKNEEAYQFLDENRVRYILCQDLPSMYQSMILDKRMLAYVSDFDKETGWIVFNSKMFPTVLYRLVWRYGGPFIDMQNQIYYPPLDRLRLVAESRGRDETLKEPEVARIKLFEYVPGARFEITGLPPYVDAVLSTKIRTPYKRSFPYIQFLRSNEEGNVSVVVPYPNDTEGTPHAEEYTLIVGNEYMVLPSVTEGMVMEGLTIADVWGEGTSQQ